MAEITASSKKSPRLSGPRIDLTPLVDLGFLLITFFVFTATLSNPAAMTTILPADSKDSSKVAESGAVSLVAAADKLYFYTGHHLEGAVSMGFDETDALRKKLIGLQQRLILTEGNEDKLFVMIKPSEKASFGHIVELLDEMKICQMKRYTLADPTADELAALAIY